MELFTDRGAVPVATVDVSLVTVAVPKMLMDPEPWRTFPLGKEMPPFAVRSPQNVPAPAVTPSVVFTGLLRIPVVRLVASV